MLGPIIPDCAVEEHHVDRLEITQHPVELGASVSDHAFMLPFEVSLRYGWSNSALANFGGSENYIDEIYYQLQGLQQSRQPFNIVTGKRLYQNMMLCELDVVTDARSEKALMVEAMCRQVIIVSTQAVSIAPNPSTDAAPDVASQQNLGVQQPTPTSTLPALFKA